MPNILTAAKAANFVRTDTSDAIMLQLLPMIDKFIERATGRDWTQDDGAINPIAEAAAGMLLVQWYDTPSQAGSLITDAPLAFGLTAALTQLEAEALKYSRHQFYGLSGAGGIAIKGAEVGDDIVKLVGIYGVTGDQSANFEGTISVCGQMQQTSGSDLSDNVYLVVLKSPADDVGV